VASIDKRPNGRYRTRWREYPCYRRDYLRTTVAMPARIFGDDFSLGDGLEDGSAHQ